MNFGQKIKGVDGSITVYENRIEISDKIQAKYGTKIIFIKDITAVQFVPAGIFSNGIIQFIFPGSNEKNHFTFFAKLLDENSVSFSKKNNDDFSEIKDFIIKNK